MKRYPKDRIDNLSDIFCAWMGGFPEERAELQSFLQSSGLKELMSESDLEQVLQESAAFSKETMLSVYALIPVKLKMASKEMVLFPQVFNRLNLKAAKNEYSSIVNISLKQAGVVFERCYAEKIRFLKENKTELLRFNSKARAPKYSHEKYQKYKAALSEEKKAARLEKKRLYMRQKRAENPEKYREIAREAWHKKTEHSKNFIRISARVKNRKYREENREAIRTKQNLWRLKMKEENPELLKEIDRRHNLNADRAESCKKYYEKNKEKLAQKARENPKVKEYKRRYKQKIRFQTKTGPTVLALLKGIADSKSL